MKNKILVGLVSIAFMAMIFLNVAIFSKNSTDGFSLSSLLIMAQAQTEVTPTCTCTQYDYNNKLLELKTCWPLFWQQKLDCTYEEVGKCCKTSEIKPCSGSLNIPLTFGCTLAL